MEKLPKKKRDITQHENNCRIAVFVFFAVFLIFGLSIYKDYGLSWDEATQLTENGLVNYNYIFFGDSHSLLNGSEKYHGPAFELFLVFIQKILQPTNLRDLFFMRHLFTFLMFYLSVFFFYLICKDRFKDWRIALTGCLFLILSPRIFADAFYNSKDIPFLSVFIISIYTLIKFHEKNSYLMAGIHAFTSAILIDIRIVGIIVPIITFSLIGIEYLLSTSSKYKEEANGLNTKKKRKERKKLSKYSFMAKPKINVISLIIYFVLLIIFIRSFWPVLWEGFLYHFIEAFKEMSRFPWYGTVLYMGDYVKTTELPWHYIPVWIIITTPIFYLILFLIGMVVLLKSFFSNPLQFYSEQTEDFVFLLWLFVPIITVIALKSILYDAWRQMFFVYPAFLLISLYGLVNFYNIIKNKLQGKGFKIARIGFMIIIVLSLGSTTLTMIKYHPYQNVYFNFLAGKNMEEIKSKFEMDYWGLSYRKGLEYILDKDKSPIIRLNVTNYPGELNSAILTPQERSRIVYTDFNDSNYFLSNYRGHKEEYPYKNEFFSVKIDDAKILVVYNLT